jgi:hypothetical protein
LDIDFAGDSAADGYLTPTCCEGQQVVLGDTFTDEVSDPIHDVLNSGYSLNSRASQYFNLKDSGRLDLSNGLTLEVWGRLDKKGESDTVSPIFSVLDKVSCNREEGCGTQWSFGLSEGRKVWHETTHWEAA